MAKKKPESFEALLSETEELVAALESGELSLEDSLRKYEKGIANLRTCAQLVSQAEARVKVLIEESADAFRLEALADEEGEEGE